MAEDLLDVSNESDEQEGADTQKGNYMTFRIGEEYYGIAISYVNEIINNVQSITAIPEVENYIKGLINIRGKIVPVIDVKVRFGQEPFEYTDRTCVIVIDVKSTMVGLIVEQVAEVITIDEKEIIPPPSLNSNGTGREKYVFGLIRVGNEVKMLLNPEKLIGEEGLDGFEQADDGNITEG